MLQRTPAIVFATVIIQVADLNYFLLVKENFSHSIIHYNILPFESGIGLNL